MASFLSNFAKKPFTVNEQIKLIHDFLDVSHFSLISPYISPVCSQLAFRDRFQERDQQFWNRED
jgi:hypothetical protein